MMKKQYTEKIDILKRAQEVIGIPLKEIDLYDRLSTGKGAIGHIIEESWFGYDINSKSEADFAEAGIELKATPYIYNKKGQIRAKERLVCNIINYMTEYKRTFETSDFWKKCQTMLIMSYEHKPFTEKSEFTIDKVTLFQFPEKDRLIVEQDWNKIIARIKKGEAHLLTEGDTLYLGACTKGASSKSIRPQPFSSIPAKQRAYSLKSSYMTQLLNNYIFGTETDENIVTDWMQLQSFTFEEIIIDKLSSYYGKTVDQLKEHFNLKASPKNINELLLSRMLGIKGRASQTNEFKNAFIIPKTVRLTKDNKVRESMSFPTFKFMDIIEQEWEDSDLREYIEPAKFLFVIFKENNEGQYYFKEAKFWNMPQEDLAEVKRVWEKTKSIIQEGVQLIRRGNRVTNNLPKSFESHVAHVRPHARNAADTYPLPDGRSLTKQCFWLNNNYIREIILGPTKE